MSPMLLVAAVALTLLSLLIVSPAEAAWRWPLRGEVRRPFVVTADRPYDAGQHRGIDLAARPGSVVRSACAGRVRFAGRVARSGGVVSVRCGALVATYLELGAVQAVRGRRVGAGAQLGVVGPAAHLHLGARDARSGRYVDPLTLLRTPRGPTLGPAPDVAPPARAPRAPAPRVAPVTGPEPAGVPVVVWVGLALVAAGLPIGGLLVRQRSRQRTSWTSTSPASRPTRSAR
jgi:hypothetical protein